MMKLSEAQRVQEIPIGFSGSTQSCCHLAPNSGEEKLSLKHAEIYLPDCRRWSIIHHSFSAFSYT